MQKPKDAASRSRKAGVGAAARERAPKVKSRPPDKLLRAPYRKSEVGPLLEGFDLQSTMGRDFKAKSGDRTGISPLRRAGGLRKVSYERRHSRFSSKLGLLVTGMTP